MVISSRREFLVLAAGARSMVTTARADSGPQFAHPRLIYIGAYGPDGGIFRCFLDGDNRLTEPVLVAPFKNASWLAICSERSTLYAVSEVQDGSGTGGKIASFLIDTTSGTLKQTSMVSSLGDGPVHLTLHPSRKFIFAANYASPSIAIIPLQSDGRLKSGSAADLREFLQPATAASEKASRFHMVSPDPDGHFLIVADAGLDRLLVGRLQVNQSGTATFEQSYETGAGTAPRHFVFSRDGKSLYVLTERTGDILHYSYSAPNGALQLMDVIAPSYFAETLNPASSEIAIGLNGNFVYAASRRNNAIAVFAVRQNGRLVFTSQTPVEGDYPRSFLIHPGGYMICCNQRSETLTLFKIDPETGTLTFQQQTVRIPKPACVVAI